MKIDVYTLE